MIEVEIGEPLNPMIAGIIVFVIACIIQILILRKKLYLKKFCTYEISALCVDELIHQADKMEGGNDTYSPVYEIYYEGRKINITSNVYTGKRHSIGTEYTIKINPDKPTDFIDDTNVCFFGLSNIILAVFMLVGLILVFTSLK